MQDRFKFIRDVGLKYIGNSRKQRYMFSLFECPYCHNLIETIKTDPQNRRMIVSLWNVEDLPDMALQPCAFQTLWDVTDGYLNCMLIQR